ncbi:hypothetical protein BJY52DRAFT_1185393 [Lactarius psammicola]|nr:hypothetical protein BJY52DRAFT_1185393 [Lactarius psammicola]
MSDYRSYPSPQKTPQRGRPSTPSKLLYAPAAQTPQASPAFPQTPCRSKGSRTISTGLPTPQITPFPKHSDGSPVKLYTPKEYAEMSLQRSGSSTTGRPRVASSTAGSPTKPRFPSTMMAPPTQRRVASATETPTRPNRPTSRPHPMSPQGECENVPPRFRTRSSSPTKAPTRSSAAPPVVDLVALRRERREPPGPTRRTVRLLSVISKCWGDDTDNYFRWTLRDSLLRGGCEEREPGDIWRDLRSVVGDLWPDLQEWIMHQTPTEEDAVWFGCAGSCKHAHHEYASSPQIDWERSSQERVGFSMSPDAFEVARVIVQELADRGYAFDCLLSADFNPFFMIYAFAHCNIHLPRNFSRQLFWKHLDAIVRFQRWSGLKSARSSSSSSGSGATGMRRAPLRMRAFPREDDPEDIVGTLLALRNTGRLPIPPPTARQTHELLLVIDSAHWAASSSSLGRFSYAVDDLAVEDVASFALLDALTRWLPHWQAGALEVRTNDVCVMWGIRGHARSSAWGAVRALCAQYDVVLRRAELVDHRSEDYARTGGNGGRGAVVPPGPLRNPDVVSAAVKGLAALGKESNTTYRAMVRHLVV